MDSEILLWFSFAIGLIIIALVFVYLIERERRKPLVGKPTQPIKDEFGSDMPFTLTRTVTSDMFKEAKEKLRILDLEREILSYAIRRLYEASAEGKITEEERDRLSLKYKDDLSRIKDEITKGESVVALNELERMQEEFVKLFSERYEELNRRIEQIRALSGIAPLKPQEQIEPHKLETFETREETKKEEKVKAKEPIEKETPSKTEKKESKPKPTEPEKTEAEKKVEEIVAEVEKVIKKLGQMEVEE